MSTNPTISVGQFEIEVVRKNIKNMHLAVYPPTGRIRLAAPIKTDAEVVRLFAVSKLGWMKKHVKNFEAQHRETPREYISGESHYFKGKRYQLKVIETKGSQKAMVKGTKVIEMRVSASSTHKQRADLLKEWYRAQLKKQLPQLIEKWEARIGIKCASWGVKQMRTKWGTCTVASKRIWFNLELAKKPPLCLEYIVCHELIHLLERTHNDRFVSLMNKYMPKWRLHREELNRLPVSNTGWTY